MDDTRQESPNEDLILNIPKRQYRQSLNKTFGTHVEKSMAFKSVSFLVIKLLTENLHEW